MRGIATQLTRQSAPRSSPKPGVIRREKFRTTDVKGMFVCSATYRDRKGIYLLDDRGKVRPNWPFPVKASGSGISRSRQIRNGWLLRAMYGAGRTVIYIPSSGPSRPRAAAATMSKGGSPAMRPAIKTRCSPLPGEDDLRVRPPACRQSRSRVVKLYEFGDRLDGSWTGISIVNPNHIGNHAPQFMADGERVVYFGNFAYEDLLEVCLYDPKVADHDLMGSVGWRLTEKADGVWRRPRAIAIQPEWEQIFSFKATA